MWNFHQQEREQQQQDFGWNLNNPAGGNMGWGGGPSMPMPMPMPVPMGMGMPQPYVPYDDPYVDASEDDIVEEDAVLVKHAPPIEGFKYVSAESRESLTFPPDCA